jgi:hypothetical protein
MPAQVFEHTHPIESPEQFLNASCSDLEIGGEVFAKYDAGDFLDCWEPSSPDVNTEPYKCPNTECLRIIDPEKDKAALESQARSMIEIGVWILMGIAGVWTALAVWVVYANQHLRRRIGNNIGVQHRHDEAHIAMQQQPPRATTVPALPDGATLIDTVGYLRRELGLPLGLTVAETIGRAATELGIQKDVASLTLGSRAKACAVVLRGEEVR